MCIKDRIISIAFAVSWSLTTICPDVLAGGFMVPHQTARGLSLGNALTAGVNDPSAVYYNPAALSEIDGSNLLVSGIYVNVINSVQNSGREATNKHDDNFLASVFANYHIPGTDFTVGMGTYSPFGLATTYDRDFTRFAAERTELKTIFVTPALSWHPSKYLSVGGGVSFVHASGLFSRSLCLDVFFGGLACSIPSLAEGRVRVTDTANALTYNIGLLAKPTDTLKFGFSYRARTDIRFDSADVKLGGVVGPGRVRADVRPIPLPPVINVGAFWKINPNWGAEFVYEYTRWSEFKSFNATFSSGPLPGFSLPKNWKNISTLRLGSYYTLNKNWEIRGGLAVEETPIPNRDLNPSIPDADKLTLNAGIGYAWDRVSVDLGYMAVFYKTRSVTNGELEGLPATGIPYLGAPGRDKYKTFNNFVALSLTYHFPTGRPAPRVANEDTKTANDLRPEVVLSSPESVKNATVEESVPGAKHLVTTQLVSPEVEKSTPEKTVAPPVTNEQMRVDKAKRVWAVQVHAFSREINARDLAQELKQKGFDAYIAMASIKGQPWYRVRVGHLATRTDATELQKVLWTKGKYNEVFITDQ